MAGYVLVGGWPASGKSTLSRELAGALGCDYLAKDPVKEALMDQLGAPASVEESRRLGRAAVAAVLRAAQGCRTAVIDSTWFDYTRPMVAALPGPLVEVRCLVPVSVARQRYRDRSRDPRHLDDSRDDSELWGSPVAPLGVGPLVNVDTSARVDVPALATCIAALLGLADGPH